MARVETPSTLIITLPTREFAAGFLAAGIVAASEQEEWTGLQALKGPVESKLVIGDCVQYASLTGHRSLVGTVKSSTEVTMTVRDSDGTMTRTFHGLERSVVVPCNPSQAAVKSQISRNLNFIEYVLGKVRARSFCMRQATCTAVVGTEYKLAEEWATPCLNFGGEKGRIVDILRPVDPHLGGGARSLCVSDRGSGVGLKTIPRDAIVIFDSHRGWQRWSKRLATKRLTILLDRSSLGFGEFLEQVQSEVAGTRLEFPDLLATPRGVEAYAFQRVAYGSL